MEVNGEKRRTKAIKRGGQHPEWDEEIRFTLFEDIEDVLARTAHGDSTPPPPPPKNDQKLKRIKGGKTMKVACYADDPREPDLIGDVEVDLTEVLTKGETDGKVINIALQFLSNPPSEWFTLTSKDKFAGKVYLELTFWSNVRTVLVHAYICQLIPSLRNLPQKRRLRQNLLRVTSITGAPAHLYLRVKCLQVLGLRLRMRRTMTILTRAWMFCLHH